MKLITLLIFTLLIFSIHLFVKIQFSREQLFTVRDTNRHKLERRACYDFLRKIDRYQILHNE